MSEERPHKGCNCGRKGKTPPLLLTDDLVIAARDRAREPELPAATEARARSTPVVPRLARYDLIILDDGLSDREHYARIAAEFARHEHRVFHLSPDADRDTRPAAPLLTRIPTSSDSNLTSDLSDLRKGEGIEAAMVVVSSSLAPELAQEFRKRWGWRIAGPSDAPTALRDTVDVQIAVDQAGEDRSSANSVVLPPTMAWPARWSLLDKAFRAAWPQASIIVLSRDNLAFSRMCVASIFENTEYPNYELILIDNGSSDGSAEELRRLAGLVPHVRAFLNDDNAGFGPGNNQGLREATGDILVLLNNDTMVPRGWLTRLARHLENPEIGLIGPASNRTCNEAQLDIPYQTYAEYQAVARSLRERHEGELRPIRMPMMFCTAFRRDVYERIGPLDERFETGMFEDEDYALRAKAAGFKVVWTPEVYVHHAYHATIGKLLPTGEYMRLVRLNQGRFEEKWGICWERHRPPPVPPT
jgi:GT2 family glycosyltransferase